jgi:hypothetical protein
MRCDLLALIFTTSILTVSGLDPDLEMDQIPDDEARARIYLDYLDKEFSKRSTQSALAEWEYASNITEENLKNKVSYGCGLILQGDQKVSMHLMITVQKHAQII